jgi:hypothetical protein
MTTDQYRALVEAGPAVVMVAKDDMLKLLDRLPQANRRKSAARRVGFFKCTNTHDRCYGGAGGPCDYCEFTICDND